MVTWTWTVCESLQRTAAVSTTRTKRLHLDVGQILEAAGASRSENGPGEVPITFDALTLDKGTPVLVEDQRIQMPPQWSIRFSIIS